jgi:SAM-dependent methyltransferase
LEHPVALDIGCGVGGSLQLLRERGWEGFGVEPDPLLARAGSEYFKVPIAPEFMRSDLFPGQAFHMMLSIHTFEHLLDPLDVARSAAQRLAPVGGLLCIVVPTYVKANHFAWEWMNTAHTYMFSGPTLGNLLARAGFETLAWKYPARRNHPDQEPSELWLLARATGVEKSASQLPFKEPLWHVQQQMLEVPPRALAAFIDHNSRRAGRFARKRILRLVRPQ